MFSSIEEEAEWWDTHDSAEFEDELEPVDDVVIESVRSSAGLLMRLDGDVLSQVERIADANGTDPVTVVRTLIEEGIRHGLPVVPRRAG